MLKLWLKLVGCSITSMNIYDEHFLVQANSSFLSKTEANTYIPLVKYDEHLILSLSLVIMYVPIICSCTPTPVDSHTHTHTKFVLHNELTETRETEEIKQSIRYTVGFQATNARFSLAFSSSKCWFIYTWTQPTLNTSLYKLVKLAYNVLDHVQDSTHVTHSWLFQQMKPVTS